MNRFKLRFSCILDDRLSITHCNERTARFITNPLAAHTVVVVLRIGKDLTEMKGIEAFIEALKSHPEESLRIVPTPLNLWISLDI